MVLDWDGSVSLTVRGVKEIGLLSVVNEEGALGFGFVEVVSTLGWLPKFGSGEGKEVVHGVVRSQKVVHTLLRTALTGGEVYLHYLSHANGPPGRP
jgi:hypothetical protein